MTAKSRRGLINRFNELTAETAEHFQHVPSLVNDYPLPVCLAYVFSQLELAQNRTLYQGVVKLHRVNKDIAHAAIGTHHMTRKGYESIFANIFESTIPHDLSERLRAAEAVRDNVMHGKSVTEAKVRSGISDALLYTDGLYIIMRDQHSLKVCGNYQGFSGRAKKHDRKTSRLILKGLGFSLD
jgi:hypothetical protein